LKVAEFVEWYSRVHDDGLREEMLGDVVLRRRLHLTNIGRRLKDPRRVRERDGRAPAAQARAGEI